MLRFLVILPAFFGGSALAAEQVDFNRDVRPILSNRCFKCHGPDAGTREAELRLDTREGLFADRGGYAAFVPGDIEGSEALRRILSEEESERMPPPEAKRDLTPREKEIVRAWIEQGAKWEPHWAFVAPRRPAVPEVQEHARALNPIDRFVAARLEREGLSPLLEADRYTLVRRVYLDLVGLPPTPEEADAFVSDPSPDAYERLVDRLLASPHYGERWARRWLDLARYADTNGYEKDRARSIWPYRDWVIDALNAGMPFDEFTVKQLAGDMLPGATLEDVIATGFHRNTMLNEEGGIDPLEFRFHAMTDRVATTGTTWLGLTTGCAQCHDHKYDPISHVEYFGLMAFLNNADEPEQTLPDAAVDEMHRQNLAEAERLIAELPKQWPVGESGWKAAKVVNVRTRSAETGEVLEDGSVLFAAPGPERETSTFVVETDGTPTDKLRIEALTHDRLPNRGPGRVEHGNFVLSDVEISASPKGSPGATQGIKLVRATADVEQEGFAAANAIDGKPRSGWAVHAGDRLNADHALTLGFEAPVSHAGGTRFVVTLRQNHGERHTIGRVRVSVPVDAPQPSEELRREAIGTRFGEWLAKERARTVEWRVVTPGRVSSNLPLLTVEEDGAVFVTGDTTKQDRYEVVLPVGVEVRGSTPLTPGPSPQGEGNRRHPGGKISAIRLEALPDERLPAGGPGMTYYEGTPGDFFLTEFVVEAGGKRVPIAKATQSYAKNRFGANPASAAMTIDGDMQTGWSVDGRLGERHTAVFTFEEPIAADELNVAMTFGRHFASSLGRFRLSVTTATNAEARDLPEEVERLLAKADGELTAAERDRLLEEFLLSAPELAEQSAKIRELRKRPASPTTLVMRERPAENPRPTHRHHRGEFLQPEEEVEPVTPAALHPFPEDAPKNRLGFARWLVSRENPLTARVAVNREWAAFFGRGIVPTLQDFGFQGEPPSHPALLDWLAVEFMGSAECGVRNAECDDAGTWDLKRLHRLIVTSHTYRQASEVRPELLARDPQNVLLARGSRVRLEAETIRDAALAAGRLLVPKMGGEPVRPPQPESVTEAAYGAFKWTPSTGQDRHRRSVYTFIKRTAPFAMFSVFDAPSGESCTARRDVSNTALQGLTLLNDEMLLEAARALGSTVAGHGGDDAEKATYAFRRVLTRRPDAEEVARLAGFVTTQRERFKSGEADAGLFAGPGEEAVERATWTALARALMSLDESVTRN